MKIDFTIDNGTLTVALDGRLDTITAPELEKFLGEKCAEADMLIFDCEKLAYISSAGLRVLLAAQKKTCNDKYNCHNSNNYRCFHIPCVACCR